MLNVHFRLQFVLDPYASQQLQSEFDFSCALFDFTLFTKRRIEHEAPVALFALSVTRKPADEEHRNLVSDLR